MYKIFSFTTDKGKFLIPAEREVIEYLREIIKKRFVIKDDRYYFNKVDYITAVDEGVLFRTGYGDFIAKGKNPELLNKILGAIAK